LFDPHRVIHFDDDVPVDYEQHPHLLIHFEGGLVLLQADILKLSHNFDVLDQPFAELDIFLLGKGLLHEDGHSFADDAVILQALAYERHEN